MLEQSIYYFSIAILNSAGNSAALSETHSTYEHRQLIKTLSTHLGIEFAVSALPLIFPP